MPCVQCSSYGRTKLWHRFLILSTNTLILFAPSRQRVSAGKSICCTPGGRHFIVCNSQSSSQRRSAKSINVNDVSENLAEDEEVEENSR